MRIGYDVSQTGAAKAGCGFFADSLIRQIAGLDRENEYILYPTFGDAFADPDSAVTTITLDLPNFRRGPAQKSTDAAKQFWGDPPADFEEELGRPDIVHSNNFFCPRELEKAKLVYTLYDLAVVDRPDLTTESNRTHCFGGLFNASLFADLIIAISSYTREHFLEVFPYYPAERIVTIYPGTRFGAPEGKQRPQDLQKLVAGEFWLSVGTLEPRKNHRRLVEAYAMLKARVGKTFPLALAGAQGWMMEGFEAYLEELGVAEDVICLGYVDDGSLAWLYRNCFALIYPSLFEGFGLPVLEAMGLGAPVIASNVSSIPEIVGDAAILVDPTSVQSILDGMLKIAGDAELRERLKTQVVRRAGQFTWDAAARATLECYRRVMAMDKLYRGEHRELSRQAEELPNASPAPVGAH
ncbi:MAG TPA: glycosyltransferase family 1 protein [Tepidisphaeraceae bacterium]